MFNILTVSPASRFTFNADADTTALMVLKDFHEDLTINMFQIEVI